MYYLCNSEFNLKNVPLGIGHLWNPNRPEEALWERGLGGAEQKEQIVLYN